MRSLRSTAKLALLAALLAGALGAGEPGMVFVPGGEFERGRTYEWSDTKLPWYPNPLKDDLPVRRIFVEPFYMDETEVTNERYAAFVTAAGHRAPYHWKKGKLPEGKERHPVVNVSWEDATAYCAWEGKRLPTEAEWERACRGTVDGKTYPWGDDTITPALAHYDSKTPAEVCSKERSALGLCDIIGNVWEWCSDWYGRNYYESAPAKDPRGPEEGSYRVLRGGSWFDQPQFLTCSYRSWARPVERSPTIGFRCAKSFSASSR
ncbi:MAG: formylglycine-generating enzyme family protein [Bryobacteraceae bacterium]